MTFAVIWVGSIAGHVERRPAQALVMEVGRIIEPGLQFSTLRNLTAQPIVAHIEGLKSQLSHHLRNAPVDLVMVDV